MTAWCRAGLHDLDAPDGRQWVTKGGKKTTVCRSCHLSMRAARARGLRIQLRARLLAMYGAACACCGIDRLVFLTLDHIGGGGATDRKLPGGDLGSIKRAVTQHRPDLYQILCFNCNAAKHIEDNHACKER